MIEALLFLEQREQRQTKESCHGPFIITESFINIYLLTSDLLSLP